MDSAILLSLIQDKGLSVTDTLTNIPYIHSGYVNIISSKEEENGRSEESNTET